MPAQNRVSVVIPMFNEEAGLDRLFSRLLPILTQSKMSFELVAVNDGSTDNTLARLLALQRQIPQLIVVDLSRRFGKEAALMAGIDMSSGQAVIPLDADLQDPPELIPQMIERWLAGVEVVIGIRRLRESRPSLRRISASVFYHAMNAIGEIHLPPHAGDFRLMDRKVIVALSRMPERSRFNKGIFAWLGFRTEAIEYEQQPRHAGKTKWRFRALWSFALDGIASFSSLPLRIWSYLGLGMTATSVGYAATIAVRAFALREPMPDYAPLMTVVLFCNGLALVAIGVVGEYVSRILVEVKGRPIYIVRDVIHPHLREED